MICPRCNANIEIGQWPFCPHSQANNLPAIHTERAIVWHNPSTGEYRIPGRADRPINPKYKAAGFTERMEITSMSAFEKRTGLIHEASNYNNSGRVERDTGAE